MNDRLGCGGMARIGVRWALLAWLAAGTAQAQFYVEGNAAAQAAYDSNVFALPSSAQAIAETGSSRRDDIVSRYAAGVDTDYHWDQQKLYFGAEGRRSIYDYFSQLDHNEYLLNGGLDWSLGSAWDGKYYFRQERSMALFQNLQTTQLTMQRERKVGGSSGVDVTPEWRVEGSLANHILALPLQTASGFSLRENTGSAALKYLGVQRLTAGLYFEYLWGRYLGQAFEDNFYQKTVDLTATYAVSGLSNLGANFGYTQRQGPVNGLQNASGFTGLLSYQRIISAKTSTRLELSRRINSYVAGANAEIDSSATAGVTWLPEPWVNIDLSYDWTESKFEGQGVIGAVGPNRLDHYQYTALRVNYQPLQWLAVQPFFRYQDRHSNIYFDGFNDLLAGVQLVLRLGNSPTGGDAGIVPAAGF